MQDVKCVGASPGAQAAQKTQRLMPTRDCLANPPLVLDNYDRHPVRNFEITFEFNLVANGSKVVHYEKN